MKFADKNLSVLKSRLWIVALFVVLAFLIVAMRLFYLQVWQRDKYAKLAGEVIVREKEITARRGSILDRRGRVLADTRVYYQVTLTPQYVSDLNIVLDNLSRILNWDKQKLIETVKNNPDWIPYHPVILAEDVSYDVVAKLSEHLHTNFEVKSAEDLSGIEIEALPVRRYLYPDLFSHVIGYMREISKTQFADKINFPEAIYSRGDLIGVSGLEKQYDMFLKGVDGVDALIVDARGREIPVNADIEVIKNKFSQSPKPGATLQTSLDLKAQMAARDFFPKGKKGAVVAIDPRTGQVLVLYSHPGFDSNQLVKTVDPGFWKGLIQDKALYNLATQGEYPPASTYKVVSLAAGIHEHKVDPASEKVTCPGGMQFGNRFFRCWKAGGHGVVDTIRSLGQSCDVFYYKLGIKTGIDALARDAHLFGYGEKTGVDLPNEQDGYIPDSTRQKNLQPSDVLSLVIGQSYNLVTPLQMAKTTAMIANGGYSFAPRIAKKVFDENGALQMQIKPEFTATELVGDPALDWVKKGMIEVVHGVGTAKKLKDSPFKIAGKTGTAQVIQFDSVRKVAIHKENHGLFIGMAPYDNPKIVVAVVVEHGGGGSSAAAPVAKAVIEAYLQGEIDHPVVDPTVVSQNP